jgi:uncharacterized protein
MMNTADGWLQNITIWVGLSSWVLAQIVKLILHVVRTHRFDSAFLFRLGGMPSSHSAAATGVAVSIGLRAGFGGTAFAIALTLALVVMIDAQSVRRAAGQQARLLNQIVDELFKTHHFPQQKLVELLGHTRLEVLLGALMGVLTALLFHSFVA